MQANALLEHVPCGCTPHTVSEVVFIASKGAAAGHVARAVDAVAGTSTGDHPPPM